MSGEEEPGMSVASKRVADPIETDECPIETKKIRSEEEEVEAEGAEDLDAKLPEIQYIEVYRDEAGKLPTITIDGTVVSDADGSSPIRADQIVGYDLMNFKVINCEDDVAQEIITGDPDGNDETQYVVHQVSDNGEELLGVADYESKDESKEPQYFHVVEKDSIPLVYFTNSPALPRNHEPKKNTLQRKRRTEMVTTDLVWDASKFKQFLYNCKHCHFKCNAIKELTAHRLKEHTTNNTSGRLRNVTKASLPIIQNPEEEVFEVNVNYCSFCDYSSISAQQVKRHIAKAHGMKGIQCEEEDEESKGEKRSRVVKRYTCEDCDFSSNSINSFEKHDCSAKA